MDSTGSAYRPQCADVCYPDYNCEWIGSLEASRIRVGDASKLGRWFLEDTHFGVA